MKNKSIIALCLISIFSLYGCDREEKMINTRVEQSKVVQGHIAEFVKACKGKLSMAIELTGTIENPMVNNLACDDMDKTRSYFSRLNDKDIEQITTNIKKINNLEN